MLLFIVIAECRVHYSTCVQILWKTSTSSSFLFFVFSFSNIFIQLHIRPVWIHSYIHMHIYYNICKYLPGQRGPLKVALFVCSVQCCPTSLPACLPACLTGTIRYIYIYIYVCVRLFRVCVYACLHVEYCTVLYLPRCVYIYTVHTSYLLT